MAVVSAVIAGSGVWWVMRDTGTATPTPRPQTNSTAVHTPTPPNLLACPREAPPPPPGTATDPWVRVRAIFHAAGQLHSPVLAPAFVPAGLGSPSLEFACVDAETYLGATVVVPGYTISYENPATHESLVFCLGPCSGGWGNFPGPPSDGGQVTVRGNAANLAITTDASRGQTSFLLSWVEEGTSYRIRMFSTGNLTKADLLPVAESLYLVEASQ